MDEARGRFHTAGEAFAKAAENSSSASDRVEHLWLAVESYALANESKQTISVVDAMFKTREKESVPVDPQKLGKALFLRAEAHRALGENLMAEHYYGEAINYQTPYAYRARSQLAVIATEQKEIDKARTMLEQNLNLLHLDSNPDREALEKTLYALARLLFNSGDFSAAARQFKQALEKFRDNPEAMLALHQLADCYREMAAKELKDSASNDSLLEQTKNKLKDQSRKNLHLAAQTYQELAKALSERAASQPLNKDEAKLLWQAQVNAAVCYYNGGNFSEAKPQFEQLAARYQGKTEELYALRGIANCYWVTDIPGNKAHAQETVQKIRDRLAKLRDADLNIGPDSIDRRAWEAWLQQVSQSTNP
jgi:tetratricopeptide (TPR) repeat protein